MSRILIIEDEEAIADLEKDYLELSGFEVEIANNGDIGLKKAMEEADFSDLLSLVWNSGKDAVAQGDIKNAIKIVN